MPQLKLAIQNCWPNLSHSAEREFIARLKIAAHRLGWSTVEVVTSDDIIAAEPDAVLVTHEYAPKLTHVPTIGIIWSPTAYYAADASRIRNILSYDGYLVASPSLRRWLASLLSGAGKQAPISTFDFVPTAPGNISTPRVVDDRTLFYAGTNWDGRRHGRLFDILNQTIPMKVYGPPEKWRHAGASFASALPFDGRSVVEAIGQCGIALALHSPDHLREDIPSMRLFEAAAAGVVVICDKLDFAQREFGDSIHYVDTTGSTEQLGLDILAAVQWVRENPDASAEMSRRSLDIFQTRFALENILSGIPELLLDVRRTMAPVTAGPSVDVIIRVGSRPLSMVRRAIASVQVQSYENIGLVIVGYRPVAGLAEFLASLKDRFPRLIYLNAPDDGIRSTPLWIGLAGSTAECICNLDDDDAIHPDHISSLVAALNQSPESPLAYSGTIQTQEDDGFWFMQPNFRGDLRSIVKERRTLKFLEEFSLQRILQLDNYIQSNAWMVRRSSLDQGVLDDPNLPVGEDLYFYLMLTQRGEFVNTWRPTAVWNWRSASRDNVMFASHLWAKILPDLRRKLAAQGIALAPSSGRGSPVMEHVGAILSACSKFISQPDVLLTRARFAISLLIHDGPRSLLSHIRRFGGK